MWAGAFPRANDPIATLPAAYAELLKTRDRAYALLAHVTLDGGELEASPPSTRELLSRVA